MKNTEQVTCDKCSKECTDYYYNTRDNVDLCPECWEEETRTEKKRK